MNISSNSFLHTTLNPFFKKASNINILRTSPIIDPSWFTECGKYTFLLQVHALNIDVKNNQEDDGLIPAILGIIDTITNDGLEKNELIEFANNLMIQAIDSKLVENGLDELSDVDEISQQPCGPGEEGCFMCTYLKEGV